jgi:glutaminyl-tRNA synthetase
VTQEEGADFKSNLNPDSLEILEICLVEPSLKAASNRETVYQFERLGYFCLDPSRYAKDGRLVFNRTVSLRDTWAKIEGSRN